MGRGLAFVAIAQAVGWLALAPRGAWLGATFDLCSRWRALAAAALGVALLAIAWRLHAHGVELDPDAPWRAAPQTWVGRVLIAQACVVAAALVASRTARTATLGAVLAWLALAGTALSGHAVAADVSPWLSAAAIAHVMVAGAWCAALGPLLLLHRAASAGHVTRPWRDVLARFSRVALPAMLAVVAAGTVVALWSVGRWPALFATPYGQWLGIKLAAVVGVFASAAWLRRWLARPAAAHRPAGRALAIECALALAVVGAAGTLADVVPGAHDAITWPYAFRWAPLDAWRLHAPDMVAPLVGAAAAIVVGGLVGLRLRRRHAGLAWGGAGTGVALAAALALPAIAVDAYPSTYAAAVTPWDAASIAAGAQLYERHCSGCHGRTGRGDGAAGAALPVRPANLTEPHVGWHTHGDLWWWITHGIAGAPMPGFGAVTTDVERWQLIDWLMALSLGHEARNLGTRVLSRAPWLPAIDLRWTDAAGREHALSDLRGREAALVVLIHDARELDRVRALAASPPGPGARVIVVAAPPIAAQLEPAAGVDVAVDADGAIAAAWGHYRRTLASPDLRDDAPLVARIEWLVDRFGFVRARWRADEAPVFASADALRAAVAALAAEPELRSPDVHAH
jgi:putative copper resistance protein D